MRGDLSDFWSELMCGVCVDETLFFTLLKSLSTCLGDGYVCTKNLYWSEYWGPRGETQRVVGHDASLERFERGFMYLYSVSVVIMLF